MPQFNGHNKSFLDRVSCRRSNYLFEFISIETYAPQFNGHNKSFLCSVWYYSSHENISSHNQIRILLEKEFQPIAGNKSVRADALLILLQDYAFLR